MQSSSTRSICLQQSVMYGLSGKTELKHINFDLIELKTM